jgi:release factor glutamine methyltransferase
MKYRELIFKRHSNVPFYVKREIISSLTRRNIIDIINQKPTTKNVLKYEKIIKGHLKGVPLQYLTEEKVFCDRKIKVKEGVFIPRPETEILVEETFRKIKEIFKNKTKLEILDLGSGSGNITVSLSKLLSKK